MTVISVDLGYKRHADIGIVTITRSLRGLDCRFIQPPTYPDPHRPKELANWVTNLAEETEAFAVMLDGPQGWKDAANGPHPFKCMRTNAECSRKDGSSWCREA